MKFTTLSRRTAAAGAASALVAGALVGATAGTAQAAPIQNEYICTTPLGPQNVTLDSDAPGIEGFDDVLPAGLAAPAGALSVDNTFSISDAFHSALTQFGVEDLAFPDFAGDFGGETVPVAGVTAKVSQMTQNPDGTWSAVATRGTNQAFTVPAAGEQPVTAPTDFTIATSIGGNPANIPCTLAPNDENEPYATLTVNKNKSASAARATNSPVKKGETAKVTVKVTSPDNPNVTPSGKVVLKLGKKTVDSGNLNGKGVAKLSYTATKVGENKLKAVYKGDGYATGSKDTTTVTVKR